MRRHLFGLFILFYCFSFSASAQQSASMGFLFFSGKAQKQNAELNWQTIQELSVSYFNLQRSTNGSPFLTIARLKAKGDTSRTNQNNYHFKEEGVNSRGDVVLYRLECVDINGRAYYSRIVSLRFEKEKKLLLLSSNAIHNLLMLHITSQARGQAIVTITNANGKAMWQQHAEVGEGGCRQDINIASLPAGIYIVSVISEGIRSVEQFIKQ